MCQQWPVRWPLLAHLADSSEDCMSAASAKPTCDPQGGTPRMTRTRHAGCDATLHQLGSLGQSRSPSVMHGTDVHRRISRELAQPANA